MVVKIKIIFVLSIMIMAIVFNSGCKQKATRPLPDISHIKMDLSLQRFEVDFNALDTSNMIQSIENLKNQYPGFYDCYEKNIMDFKAGNNDIQTAIKKFLGFGGYQAVYDSTMEYHPDLIWLKDELTEAFRYSQYFLPDDRQPEIVTYISHYGYGAVICSDSVLGIGLDLFLGKNFSYYPMLNFPEYIIRLMDREYIVPNTMKAYIQNKLTAVPEGNSLLDFMVHKGKELYYLDLVLPTTPNSIKIGYSSDQMEWCLDNESGIWAYFMEGDRLFSNNPRTFNYLINPSNTTQGMPPASPGNMGSWVGWQIVKSYMENNIEVSLPQLLMKRNGQVILNRSGYRPVK